MLDMFDRRNVKVTSHMVGAAVERHPALAKEIVQCGYEPSGHEQTWTPQYSMTPEQERQSYADSAATMNESPAYGPSASMLSGCGVLAVDALPHGARILEPDCQRPRGDADQGRLNIVCRRAHGYVLIELDETGPGIPQDIRNRLFEPFVTAGKQDGLGLGLAISRQTVCGHGRKHLVGSSQRRSFCGPPSLTITLNLHPFYTG